MDELVQDFKDMEKIDHTSEDIYIKKLLKRSYEKLQRDYGKFDIDKNLIGRELVLNRTRYAYQDLLEYFNENYRVDLIDFGISLVEVEDDEETI
ncbi:phage head-tail adapter protein [Staphylococcus aureus]|uniref:phage head-tail adapter protein n=1 Tax=Staphylococcus aureus TaxID=1280 RepID=UPI0013A6FEA0|nr:phage head-tail adapter protein [Staphylococcus aureus]NDQ49653.1 phage head-tail adapter protein [Staphylococcus aureus]NDQ71976.1 phage head-tail adapter protein [Staphylococcus aureus]NDQ78590.1 phage head-tail adapter protein [Staphylococcus aureus]NDQ94886.1 phage head-tail adapter protein [Staphylococcus aureus]NDR41409.1 phage head-tail adapter protein [Staphylococcus aureus]